MSMTCNNRFLDVSGEDLQVQLPISGFFDPPFQPLDLRESVKMLNLKHCEGYIESVEKKSSDRQKFLSQTRPNEEFIAELHIQAIMMYTVQWRSGTKDSLYYNLNHALRVQNRDMLKPYSSYLHHLLQALFAIETNEHLPTLYRAVAGANMRSLYPDGSIICWSGFSSTTSKIGILENFLKGGGGIGTLFSIKSFNAKAIKDYSFYENEEEYMIPPFSRFRVSGSLMIPQSNYVLIILEQVASSDQQYLFETCAFNSSIAEIIRHAQRGSSTSQTYLGWMYSQGEGGVQKDDCQAVFWYRKAAEQGYATGQCHLAFMYLNGRGVDEDYKAAFDWYRKAADQDHSDAQCGLAFLYAHGQGVFKDEQKAFEWYSKAAQQGNERAKMELESYVQRGFTLVDQDELDCSSSPPNHHDSAQPYTPLVLAVLPNGSSGSRSRFLEVPESAPSFESREWESELKGLKERWADKLLGRFADRNVTDLDFSHVPSSDRGGDDELKFLARILPNSQLLRLKLHSLEAIPLLKQTFDGFRAFAVSLPFTKITYLDISNYNLGDRRVEWLASILPRCQNLVKLYVRDNKITDFGAEKLAEVIPRTQISLLDLQHNNIQDDGAKAFLSTFTESKLAYLYIHFNDISEPVFKSVLEALPTISVQKLHSYSVEKNLSTTKSQRLMSLFAVNEFNAEELGDDEAFLLGQILPHSKLQAAAFKGSYMTSSGVTYLLSALPRSILSSFSISSFHNDLQLPDLLAFVISRYLPYSQLKILSLTHDQISNQGAYILSQVIPRSSLRVLDLSSNNLTDVGANCLFSALPKSKIKVLILSDNDFGFMLRFFSSRNYKNILGETVEIEMKELHDWLTILKKYNRL
eukprot:TRINITY_DN12256_c0_g1_i1.p1 TRINITY_DN12256_c0_g1~~TRINITY_DN12256_c0_g1_i1.p1  ORF type:complete len:862 (-),score=184.65 TRINITY_DN12256_c0_g1_i1:51-2636(-)